MAKREIPTETSILRNDMHLWRNIWKQKMEAKQTADQTFSSSPVQSQGNLEQNGYKAFHHGDGTEATLCWLTQKRKY